MVVDGGGGGGVAVCHLKHLLTTSNNSNFDVLLNKHIRHTSFGLLVPGWCLASEPNEYGFYFNLFQWCIRLGYGQQMPHLNVNGSIY